MPKAASPRAIDRFAMLALQKENGLESDQFAHLLGGRRKVKTKTALVQDK